MTKDICFAFIKKPGTRKFFIVILKRHTPGHTYINNVSFDSLREGDFHSGMMNLEININHK